MMKRQREGINRSSRRGGGEREWGNMSQIRNVMLQGLSFPDGVQTWFSWILILACHFTSQLPSF